MALYKFIIIIIIIIIIQMITMSHNCVAQQVVVYESLKTKEKASW